MHHVIGTKDTQREVLCKLLEPVRLVKVVSNLEVPAHSPPSSLLDGHPTDLQ